VSVTEGCTVDVGETISLKCVERRMRAEHVSGKRGQCFTELPNSLWAFWVSLGAMSVEVEVDAPGLDVTIAIGSPPCALL